MPQQPAPRWTRPGRSRPRRAAFGIAAVRVVGLQGDGQLGPNRIGPQRALENPAAGGEPGEVERAPTFALRAVDCKSGRSVSCAGYGRAGLQREECGAALAQERGKVTRGTARPRSLEPGAPSSAETSGWRAGDRVPNGRAARSAVALRSSHPRSPWLRMLERGCFQGPARSGRGARPEDFEPRAITSTAARPPNDEGSESVRSHSPGALRTARRRPAVLTNSSSSTARSPGNRGPRRAGAPCGSSAMDARPVSGDGDPFRRPAGERDRSLGDELAGVVERGRDAKPGRRGRTRARDGLRTTPGRAGAPGKDHRGSSTAGWPPAARRSVRRHCDDVHRDRLRPIGGVRRFSEGQVHRPGGRMWSGMARLPWCAWCTPGGTTTGTTASPRASAITGARIPRIRSAR